MGTRGEPSHEWGGLLPTLRTHTHPGRLWRGPCQGKRWVHMSPWGITLRQGSRLLRVVTPRIPKEAELSLASDLGEKRLSILPRPTGHTDQPWCSLGRTTLPWGPPGVPGKGHTALGATRGSLGRTTLPWGSPEGPWEGPHCPGDHWGSLGRTTLPWGPPGVLVGLHSAEVNRQQGTEVAAADTRGPSSRACTSCLITPAW